MIIPVPAQPRDWLVARTPRTFDPARRMPRAADSSAFPRHRGSALRQRAAAREASRRRRGRCRRALPRGRDPHRLCQARGGRADRLVALGLLLAERLRRGVLRRRGRAGRREGPRQRPVPSWRGAPPCDASAATDAEVGAGPLRARPARHQPLARPAQFNPASGSLDSAWVAEGDRGEDPGADPAVLGGYCEPSRTPCFRVTSSRLAFKVRGTVSRDNPLPYRGTASELLAEDWRAGCSGTGCGAREPGARPVQDHPRHIHGSNDVPLETAASARAGAQ